MTTYPNHQNQQDLARAAITRITAAMAANRDDIDAAVAMPHTTDAERATRAHRLACVYARRAAWWGVLARWTYRVREIDLVYGQATLVAQQAERDRARFWRDVAADWRARAERRATSDAAGAMSNWAELGVSA